jgi:hypothetical protein
MAGKPPAVGTCWNGTLEQENRANWAGPHAVRCTQDHTAYTYASPTLPDGMPTALFDSEGYVDQVILRAADAACDSTFVDFSPAASADQVRIYRAFLFPTRVQWAAGARWIRCDVAELALGSRVQKPQLGKLPARISALKADISGNPGRYRFCVNTPGGAGEAPLDTHAVYADCTGEPRPAWTFEKTFPLDNLAKYPTDKEFDKLVAKYCDTLVSADESTYAYSSTLTEWNENNRYIDCWASAGSGASG